MEGYKNEMEKEVHDYIFYIFIERWMYSVYKNTSILTETLPLLLRD